jgi:hypothetical protein
MTEQARQRQRSRRVGGGGTHPAQSTAATHSSRACRRAAVRSRLCPLRSVPCQPSPPAPPPRALSAATRELARLPASERIRYRLIGAQCRYHANDNIADFIEDGEIDELKAEVTAKMQEVLRALVIDTDSDHNTQETAKRVAKMFINEVAGRCARPSPITNVSRLNN